MQDIDTEKDIYQELGPDWDQAQEIDYEFISKNQTEGVCIFNNSNTVHECRFNIISTSTVEKPPIHLEVILTEQMVQVNDLNTKSIYVDAANSSGLIQGLLESDEEPVFYWLYLKSQISSILTSKLDLTKPNYSQISIWIGTGKEVNKETMIYRKTLPFFVDNEGADFAHAFPLNIRNTSKYSYMNILDMPPMDLPIMDPIPMDDHHKPTPTPNRTLSTLWGWRSRCNKQKHPISEHIVHILDKSTLPID